MSVVSRQRNGYASQETMPAGVRYIGEDLIRKVSGQDQLEQITSLNLTLARDSGKIKHIENLDRLKKLESLNLSNNCIEKIDKLEKLTRLRELNLSFNCIVRIENLEPLVSLQVLILSGNQIESIPPWFPKKLKALRTLKIDRNRLNSDLCKLRTLSNLVELSVAENPVSQLPHCRLYLVFHLRTLQTLDEKTVDFQERQAAHARFAQEELEKVMEQLNRKQTEYERLMDAHDKSLHEVEEKSKKQHALEETTKQLQAKLKEMNNELETKTNLLKKKTAEVTKACEKHYELEQELAFYKIDHKFDSLSRPLDITTPDGSMLSDGSGSALGESPYIGKGRFHPNEHAVEHQITARPGHYVHGTVNGSVRAAVTKTVPRGGPNEMSEVDGVSRHQSMAKAKVDEELQKKIQAINLAEARLREQNDQLKRVEERLSLATLHLQRAEELKQKENSKKQTHNSIVGEISDLRTLQEEAQELEQNMRTIKQEIVRDEVDVKRLHVRLQQMNPRDQQYSTLQIEIANREHRLKEANRHYQQMNIERQEKLQSASYKVQEIQSLEEQLHANGDSEAKNIELRREMESAVNSLNTYLEAAREETDEQNEQFGALVKERILLTQRIKELEQLNEMVPRQTAEITHLREHINRLEDSMREAADANQSLQHQLNESRVLESRAKNSEDPNVSVKLLAAEDELQRLRQSVKDLQAQREKERQEFAENLNSERKKLNSLKHRVRNGDAKEQEISDLHSQLAELQGANARLQDRIYSMQQKVTQQKEQSVDPDALRRRLEEVSQALRQYRKVGGQPGGNSTVSRGTMSDDPIEKAIGDLERNVQAELSKNIEDVEHALKAKEKMERQVADLKDEIAQVQEQERSMAERAIQAVYTNERQEADILRDEIRRLEDELRKAYEAANRNQVPTSRRQQDGGQTSEETTSYTTSYSRSGSQTRSASTSTGSTSSSSQWTVRRRDLVNTMTEDERELFDELQDELAELRRLLAARDLGAVPKLEDVKRKSEILKTMIDQRQQTAGSYYTYSSSSADSADTASQSTYDSRSDQLSRTRADVETTKSRPNHRETSAGSRSQPRHRSRRSAEPVTRRDAAVGAIHSVLDEQNNEIDRLQTMVDQLTNHRQANYDYPPDQHAPRQQRSSSRHVPRQHYSRPQDYNTSPQDYNFAPRDYNSAGPDGPVPPYDTVDAGMYASPDDYIPDNRNMGDGFPPGEIDRYPYAYPDHAYPSSMQPVPAISNSVGFPSGRMPPVAAIRRPRADVAMNPLQNAPGFQPVGGFPSYAYQPTQPQNVAANGISPFQNGLGFPSSGEFSANAYHPIPPQNAAQGLQQFSAVPVLQPSAVPQPVIVEPTVVRPENGVVQGFQSAYAAPILQPAVAPPPVVVEPVVVRTDSNVQGHLGQVPVGTPPDPVKDSGALMCNVPEHHDLEDYVAKLQEKNKRLKAASKQATSGRQVSFEDDTKQMSKRAVLKLQHELDERQAELEALDLAVERQREICRRLSFEEQDVLDQLRRSGSMNDVEFIRASARDRLATQRMRGSMENIAPGSYVMRRDRLMDELECLEQTISSRRAELHETEQRLVDHNARLEAVQTETGAAKAGQEKIAREIADLEERASVAGTQSLALAAEIARLQDEVDTLRDEKLQLTQTLAEIGDVITAKDGEFREVLANLNAATEKLHDVQSRLDVVSELELRRLTAGQMQDELTRSREELDAVQQKIANERKSLEQVHSELAESQQDLQLLVEAIDKRHSILESLDSQLDSEITKRRQDIENASKESESLLAEKRQLEEDILTGRSQRDKIYSEIQRAEDMLRQIKLESAEYQSRLHNVDNQLSTRRNELGDIERRANEKRSETERIIAERDRIMQELDAAVADNRRKSSELEKLQSDLVREKRLVDHATDQRKHLELTITNLQRDKSELEATQQELSDKITELLRERTAAESLVREQQQALTRASTELNRVESVVDDTRRRHSVLESELTQLASHLRARQLELDGINADIGASRMTVKALAEERERRYAERGDLLAEINLLDGKTVEMRQVLQSLTLELDQVSSQVADYKGELNELDGLLMRKKTELSCCEMDIETLKREAEQLRINKTKFLSLEERLKNIGEELERRNHENDRLVSALHRTNVEMEQRTTVMTRESGNLQDQMKMLTVKASRAEEELQAKNEELKQLKDMALNERSSLELTVRTHMARANRLVDELSYLRSINMELRRRLDTQEQIGERETSLVDALHSLKSDLKYEVTENVREIERSRLVATELSELQSNNDNLRQCVDDLKQNLHLIQDVSLDEPSTSATTVNTKDFFTDHQELLKMQLRQKMQRHADAVNTQKRLSQNTIHNLRRKLTNLEQVLSQTDSAKLAQLESKLPNSELQGTSLNQTSDRTVD